MNDFKPTVGRIVHYFAYGTPCGTFATGTARAAIITQVHTDTCVDLAVLNPTGMWFNTSVERTTEGKPGKWDEPPRS